MESQDAIFLTARDMADPAERAAYLSQACGTDADLRQRVEAMLRDAAGADEFFGPEAAAAHGPAVTEGPGTVIGRFKLLQKIGEGGMGVVYMAEQREPVIRKVALKIIKLGMDTRQVVARFEAERQALALMDHPNIAKVLDGGVTSSGRPYFVMDLVPGLPITQFCDEANLSTHDRLELFLEVCSAIQHAHQKGVIHRDIKPSNILVTLHGDRPVPKVIDFGVAKAIQGRLTEKTLFTQFQQFIGTPAYMSPEQASLSGLDIDTRSDIYALGVLLYELLTGRTPFDGKELLQAGLDEMRRTIREKQPPRPSNRISTLQGEDLTTTARQRRTDPPKLIHLVRGDLDWIVMKALEKDRARRYETANGLAMDIKRHLQKEPVVARPPSNLYRLQKFAGRNKLVFAASLAVMASLILALAVVTVAALRIQGDNRQIRKAKDQATEKLRVSYLAEARAMRTSQRQGQRFASLSLVSNAAAIRRDLAVRNEAIACLAVSDLRVSKETIYQGHAPSDLVVYDFDLEKYAVGERDGSITIHAVSDDHALAVLPAPGFSIGRIYGFSPNSRFLKVAYRGGAEKHSDWVWDVAEQKAVLRELPNGEPTAIGDLAADFSSDSRLFARCELDGTLIIYELASGKELKRLRGTRLLNHLILNPGNTQMACSSTVDPIVEIREIESGRIIQKLDCVFGVEPVAWSPDGKRLATGCVDNRIYTWDLLTAQRPAIFEGHTTAILNLAFNHAGDLLASSSFDNVVRLWDAASGRRLASHPGSSWDLQFSADDRQLLGWQNVNHHGWLEVGHSRECRLLHTEHDGDYGPGPEFSADGRIVVAGTGHQVRFWDALSCQDLGFFALKDCDGINFHPDGRSVYVADRSSGVSRRSLARTGSAGSPTYKLGKPIPFYAMEDARWTGMSRDCRYLAFTREREGEAFVIDLQDPNSKVVQLGPHPRGDCLAFSPDGRWVATAAWLNSFVEVWDARSGDLALTLNLPYRASVTFSPDGHWLATSTTEYQLWEVGTWKPKGPSVPGHPTAHWNFTAFSPDARIMARTVDGHKIQLVETLTEKPLATLEAPDPIVIGKFQFSPDGSHLAALQQDQQVQLWDLRLLRQELADMHLDWDMPPYPPADPAVSVTLEIEPDPTNSASIN